MIYRCRSGCQNCFHSFKNLVLLLALCSRINIMNMATVSCTSCSCQFEADTTDKARSMRDIHKRSCVSSITVKYDGQEITLTRNESGKFRCYCDAYNHPHDYETTDGLKRHVASKKCKWVGEVRICLNYQVHMTTIITLMHSLWVLDLSLQCVATIFVFLKILM